MQSITSAEQALLEAYAPVHLHLYLGGAEIPAELGSFTLTAAVGDGGLTCGNAIASQLDLSLENRDIVRLLATHDGKIIQTHDGKILAARLRPSALEGMRAAVTWDVDGETEHGLFDGTVERVAISGGQVTVTAQDALFWAGSKPFPVASYQSDIDAATAFAAIASVMGVSVAAGTTSLLTGVTISGGFSSCPADLICAEAAGYVAGLFGGNAVIDRDGKLAVVQYSASGFTTEPYSGGAAAENSNYKITGLSMARTYQTRTTNADGTISESENQAVYSAGDGSLELDNPLANQAAATRAYNALRAVTVRKGSFEYPMGIQVEPGDVITVESMDGSYPVAVCSHTLSIDGGVKSSDQGAGQLCPDGTNGVTPADLAAASTQTRALRSAALRAGSGDEDSAEGETITPGRTGPLSTRMDRLELELLKVKNLVAENAEINNANIQSLHAGNIDVDALFARDITATGKFQVNNTAYSLIQDNNGLRLGPGVGTEAPMSYLYLTNTNATLGSRNALLVESDNILKLAGAFGVEVSGQLQPAEYYSQSDYPPLGASDRRWQTVYLYNSPNISSDRNVKQDITESVPDIVDALRPVRYKRRGGPETVHYGFIAQDVEQALAQAGVDTADLGLVTFEQDRDGSRKNYALAYSEFIPLLVDKFQRQQKQIDEMTRRIEALERSEKHG